MFKKKNVKAGAARKVNYKRITFKLHAPNAQRVSLAGDFNSWDQEMHPLKKSSAGLWKKMVSLSPGRYEYRFVVDGEWRNDPNCNTCSPNPFGGDNCVLILPAGDEKVPPARRKGIGTIQK